MKIINEQNAEKNTFLMIIKYYFLRMVEYSVHWYGLLFIWFLPRKVFVTE